MAVEQRGGRGMLRIDDETGDRQDMLRLDDFPAGIGQHDGTQALALTGFGDGQTAQQGDRNRVAR